MSGETVILEDGPQGNVAALVRAAGTVATHAGVPIALIGGLAVVCRVSTGTRATGDVDVVTDSEADLVGSASAADNLVAAQLARRDAGTQTIRLWVGPTKLEIIETQAVPAERAEGIEPELTSAQLQRAFVDDVTRTRRRLVVYGDTSWAALLSEDRLIDLALGLS